MPALQPDAIHLAPTSTPRDTRASLPIAISDLPGVVIRQSGDSVHVVWQADGVDHQFWLEAPAPDAPSDFTVVLPFDALFDLRTHAARRLWRAINGRSPGRPLRPLPKQTRDRHILTLRALDARLAGESYRTIAEVLLGFRGQTKNDWEVSPLKNRARRLVADGLYYMRGGYRTLLHYPIRLSQRR